MGPSAVVGVIALIAIEYAANGGQLTARAPKPDPTFRVRLDRSACFGPCPSYSVEVDAAGDVGFVGANSVLGPDVRCQGQHRWKIRSSVVAALEAGVDASGFFSMKPAYRAEITDAPTFVVTITRSGRTRSVTDYAGDRVGMPRAMVDLENAIDDAASDGVCLVRPMPAGQPGAPQRSGKL